MNNFFIEKTTTYREEIITKQSQHWACDFYVGVKSDSTRAGFVSWFVEC